MSQGFILQCFQEVHEIKAFLKIVLFLMKLVVCSSVVSSSYEGAIFWFHALACGRCIAITDKKQVDGILVDTFTRCAPTSFKWSFDPYKGLKNW